MDTPEIVLDTYQDLGNDESDVYGHDHLFGFTQGSYDDIETVRSAIVEVKVGDALHNEDPVGKVAVRGWVSFPMQERRVEGHLEFGENPDIDELTVMAGNIASALMVGSKNIAQFREGSTN